MTEQARNHCFTLNNPVGGDIERIMQWDCKYIIIGEEVGAEAKTPHLQGYVEWKTPKRLSTLKALDARVHWEARRGTAQQAADYCRKDGKVHENGTMSKQGKRSDLDDVGAAIVAGASLREVAETYPGTFIKYSKGIKELKATLYQHRTVKPIVSWIYGPAGTGKTRTPVERHQSSHYIKDATPWWDGYEQQQAIIVDDFDARWPYRDLLRLLDRYQYQGQYKGGYIPINSPYIYITCEHPPSTFWAGNELAQVVRRLDEVLEIASATTHLSCINAQRLAAGLSPI